ncbi:hypothetical protein RRG08_060913 [Elysia crispata]|uniref:Uncharacterized protein n=1 Tax=Elysia crispata TaxID=231223 RepID=A0AAE0Z205_9GAST|nr:hypothetical protein RRG08_060913 [Elysia crispata]
MISLSSASCLWVEIMIPSKAALGGDQSNTTREGESQVHPEPGSSGTSFSMPGNKRYKVSSMSGAGFWQQLKVMVWRNIKLKSRNRAALAQELIFPVYFVAILAMIKLLTKPQTKPSIEFPSNLLNSSAFGQPFNAGKEILAAPDSAQYNQWMKEVVQQLPGPPTYRMFNSSAAAEAYYVDSKDTTKENIVAGVVFSYSNDPNAYAIRIKPGSLPGTTDFYNFDKGSCRGNEEGTDWNCPPNSYMTSGFALLQVALENVLMKNMGLTTPDPAFRDVQFLGCQHRGRKRKKN